MQKFLVYSRIYLSKQMHYWISPGKLTFHQHEIGTDRIN